jgi:uncharacterized OB-fold protein
MSTVDARTVHDPAPLPEKAKPRGAPAADLEQAAYWDATGEGRLLVQRCADGHHQLYPRAHCVTCREPVDWVDASGFATVYSFTVLRQHHSRALRHLLPVVVALVDLDEGPRMMTHLVGVEPEDVRVGMPVEVWFERVSETAALPMFTPVTG